MSDYTMVSEPLDPLKDQQDGGNLAIYDDSIPEREAPSVFLYNRQWEKEKVEQVQLVRNEPGFTSFQKEENFPPQFEVRDQVKEIRNRARHCREVVKKSPEDIVLLIMSRFASQNNSDSCVLKLDENKREITISAADDTEINDMKRKIENHLSAKLNESRPYNSSVCKLLDEKTSKQYLRTQFIDKKIKAHLTVLCESSKVRFSSFDEEMIQKAFQFIDDNLIVSVTLEPLQVAEAPNLVENISKSIRDAVLYQQGFDICIFSIDDRIRTAAKEEVVKGLKVMNPSQKHATVQLLDAQARCFQGWCQDQLYETFR